MTAPPADTPAFPDTPTFPDLAAIQHARASLGPLVRETPAWQWLGHRIEAAAPRDAKLWLKLETLQHTSWSIA